MIEAAGFEERDFPNSLGELAALVPAFAATVHKSQGSEYPGVVISVLTQHYAMLLHTGVTRGKRKALTVDPFNDDLPGQSIVDPPPRGVRVFHGGCAALGTGLPQKSLLPAQDVGPLRHHPRMGMVSSREHHFIGGGMPQLAAP